MPNKLEYTAREQAEIDARQRRLQLSPRGDRHQAHATFQECLQATGKVAPCRKQHGHSEGGKRRRRRKSRRSRKSKRKSRRKKRRKSKKRKTRRRRRRRK